MHKKHFLHVSDVVRQVPPAVLHQACHLCHQNLIATRTCLMLVFGCGPEYCSDAALRCMSPYARGTVPVMSRENMVMPDIGSDAAGKDGQNTQAGEPGVSLFLNPSERLQKA